MRSNYARAPPRPVPASRAPHASTAKVDSTELRNPAAIFSQAVLLSQKTSAPQPGRPSPAPPLPQLTTFQRLSALPPFSAGSSSTLFRTVIKQPMLTQVYMHGDFQSNAPDVLRQFTAELRLFNRIKRHQNIVQFVGNIDGVGMILEYVDGETLFKWLGRGVSPKIRTDWFNQVLAGLCHIHSYALAHNDLCTLNVIIVQSKHATPKYTVKLIDFGRSTIEAVPSAPQHEEIFPGTRPFAAPEIMRLYTEKLRKEEEERQAAEAAVEEQTRAYGTSTEIKPPLPLNTPGYMGGMGIVPVLPVDTPMLPPVPPPQAPTPPTSPGAYHPALQQPRFRPIPASSFAHRPFTTASAQRNITPARAKPLSGILADTYSLGVIALCIDLDELVDVEPEVQMAEQWDPGFDRLTLFPGPKGIVQRYMMPVAKRVRCRPSDAVEVDWFG